MISINEWSDYQRSHNALCSKVSDRFISSIKANRSIPLAKEMTKVIAPDFMLVKEDKELIDSYFCTLKNIDDFSWPICGLLESR